MSRRQLVDELRAALAAGSAGSAWIRDALLAYGSQTPDNLAAIARIGVVEQVADTGPAKRGLGLPAHGLMLSDVVWRAIEGDAGERLVLSAFPQLARQDAEAVLRVCMLLLTALEAESPG